MEMSAEEFKERRLGKPEEEFQAENLSAKNFILNRAKELIDVPIEGEDGTINIQIRARLTKTEIKEHKKFLDCIINEEDFEPYLPKFLATITTDEELDEEFWSLPELDSSISQEIVLMFFNKAASIFKQIQKFRK